MSLIKLVISGGRDHHLTSLDLHYFNTLVSLFEIDEFIHGACDTGVDAEIDKYIKDNLGKDPTTFPANWEQLSNAAGPIRNREMAKYGNVLVAFKGDKGTNDMVKAALSQDMLIFDFRRINET